MRKKREKIQEEMIEQLQEKMKEENFIFGIKTKFWGSEEAFTSFLGVLNEKITLALEIRLIFEGDEEEDVSGEFFLCSIQEHKNMRFQTESVQTYEFQNVEEMADKLKKQLNEIELKNVFYKEGLFFTEETVEKIKFIGKKAGWELNREKIRKAIEDKLIGKNAYEREDYIESSDCKIKQKEGRREIYFFNLNKDFGYLIQISDIEEVVQK